ncbi:MAG TPA: phosphoribosylaminoimidazolesuccinocarboxamide synthase [Candidatus Saccharimonadales bacterium]|jgi:phosphoribosylaminoimidazole-succinocarboxamide synthase|nr:phosphoribosylaminoimidazolesuccinocarboxamide synthase [Candidatus Saccharimonadales bacterium]
MGTAISTTDFKFPGQTALYHGKVRDVYTVNNQIIMVATDRISAFDIILPKAIPYKGQVLNQLAAHFLEKTSDILPNWLKAVPDANVSVGVKAEPVMIEMIVRGCLVGSAWREYQAGNREICGVKLPDGLQEYDKFEPAIVTPTTKAEEGHDENITPEEIVAQGLATTDEWQQLSDYALKLFARGQAMARSQGLVLADTKYEFGRLDGKIILIDEIHTPDSSRYFYADSFDKYVGGDKSEKPRQLSKEFVREWLMERGYSGQSDQTMPELPNEFINQISERYIELYEEMSGEKFVKAEGDPLLRIEAAVNSYLQGAA